MKKTVLFVPYLAGVLLLMGGVNKFLLLNTDVPFKLIGSVPLGTAVFILLLATELTTGMWLIFADQKLAAVKAAAIMFALFTGYLVLNHYFWPAKTCGCGAGEQLFKSRAAQFRFSMIRNVVLVCGLGAYAWPDIRRGVWRHRQDRTEASQPGLRCDAS